MTTALPHSARVAWWVTAWLRGQASSDDVLEELSDPDLVLRFARRILGAPDAAE